MKYKEQLEQEIRLAQLQLVKAQAFKTIMTQQRDQINSQLLKAELRIKEAQATITNNEEILRSLAKMEM